MPSENDPKIRFREEFLGLVNCENCGHDWLHHNQGNKFEGSCFKCRCMAYTRNPMAGLLREAKDGR